MSKNEILLVGEAPEFDSLAVLLRQAGIGTRQTPASPEFGFETEPVSAMICDARQACAELIGEASNRGIPVVVLVNDRSPRAMESWLEAGASSCLARPFPLYLMLRSIASALVQ